MNVAAALLNAIVETSLRLGVRGKVFAIIKITTARADGSRTNGKCIENEGRECGEGRPRGGEGGFDKGLAWDHLKFLRWQDEDRGGGRRNDQRGRGAGLRFCGAGCAIDYGFKWNEHKRGWSGTADGIAENKPNTTN